MCSQPPLSPASSALLSSALPLDALVFDSAANTALLAYGNQSCGKLAIINLGKTRGAHRVAFAQQTATRIHRNATADLGGAGFDQFAATAGLAQSELLGVHEFCGR